MHALLLAALLALGPVFDSAFPQPPETPNAWGTAIPGVFLAVYHFVRVQTARAGQRLQPALTVSSDEAKALVHRLVRFPPRMAVVVALLSAVYVALALTLGGETDAFAAILLPVPLRIVSGIGWVFGEAVGFIFIIATIRRLVLLDRIQKDLVTVSLFRQQPLHAFSAVTISASLGLLVMALYVPITTGASLAEPVYLWSAVVMVLLAVVLAVLPLQRVHQRLVGEKESLGLATGARLEKIVAALDQAVDRMDVAAIDANQKALGAQLAHRDLVLKAPTWPWAPGTLRTLATTLLVPVVLLTAGKVLDAWLRGEL